MATALAAEFTREPPTPLVTGAEADGPYLNLRIDRRRFATGILDSARTGSLVECRHGPWASTRYCLVSADDAAPADLLELLGGMAANCSGTPADPLELDAAAPRDLVDRLVAAGIAESDPSGLTEAVLMGETGDRFLLVSVGGEPTPPAAIAARLASGAGRPVLLTVGAHNLELVHRVESVAEAAGLSSAEVRVIEVRRRWLRLAGEVQRGCESSVQAQPDPVDLGEPAGVGDETFAVHRALARLAEVNHRTLEAAEPDHMLRFGKDLRRRLAAAVEADAKGARSAVASARLALVHLVEGGHAGA